MLKIKNVFLHLIVMSLFVGFVIAIRLKPITRTLEFDYDEGLNLIKALLYSEGFSLYKEIWSDQPPFLTVLLSHWFSLFGQSIFAARFLIVLFSALLIWSFYQIVHNSLGRTPALIATLLLFTSWQFIRLSISVMIGVPSLSLAMLSIYMLTLYKRHPRKRFIVSSGGLLALSLQTKLFTIFLIPLMLFYLFDFRIKGFDAKKPGDLLFYPILFWLCALFGVYTFIGFFCHSFNYEQLVQAHLGQSDGEGLLNFRNLDYLRYLISQDYDYVFLAFIGSLAIFLKKQREGLFPLTWLATAILILLNYKPIWYHYYPLLAIPISWLSAYGVALVLDFFPEGWHSNFKSLNIKKLIFPCFAIALLIFSIVAIPAKPIGKPDKNLKVIELVLKHSKSTQWLFTDRPIYGFYAGLRVPPEIAVMSYKRFNSGKLTNDYLLAVLQTYRPEQIVLARWTSRIKNYSKLSAYINENYSKTYQNETGEVEHYLLRSIPERSLES